MHRLHLLRHAKSNYPEGVDDLERPLSRRGRDAAHRVGKDLAAAGAIDLVLCSTALRARETAALVLAGVAPPPRIRYEGVLYLAGATVLLRRLQALEESVGAVLLIGHNPGLHELAVRLAAPTSPRYPALAAGKFPTAARASFAIDARWPDLGRSPHSLTDYVTAKSLEE